MHKLYFCYVHQDISINHSSNSFRFISDKEEYLNDSSIWILHYHFYTTNEQSI
jgi:hypothetical protein